MDLFYSERIKKQRQERAWSQEQLAQVSGVSVRTIQRIENGHPASFESLNAIASAFDIDVKDFAKQPAEPTDELPCPDLLLRIRSGSALFKVVGGADGYQFDNPSLESETETDLVSSFFQDLHDWGEIWDDLEPGQRVITAQEFNERIADLEVYGLWVFALRLPRPFRPSTKPVTLSIATVNIVRSNDPSILKLAEEAQEWDIVGNGVPL